MNGDGENIYITELNPENGEVGLNTKNNRSASQILYETLVDRTNCDAIVGRK